MVPPGRRALLGGLKDEFHGAGQIVAHSSQHLGDTHQHRRVCVVAARVHDADVLTVVGRADFGGEGYVDFLGHGKRIHVGAERDHGTRLAAAEHSNHARVRDAGPDLQP
jgi:hypothetical protein